jgi:hypothetical protein
MSNEEVNVSLPIVNLEECDIQNNAIQVDTFVAQGAITREVRLQELRKRIRIDHLKDQERSIINVCIIIIYSDYLVTN